MTGVPGLGKLIDDCTGDPATLRWLSIHPDGRVVERISDNRIAWSTEHEMWVQWRLVRDVYREVDPTSRGYNLAAAVVIHTAHAAVVMARFDTGPINPVATGMLGDHGVEHEVHGTVAWLAPADPETGMLHGDLTDDQLAALRTLAERYGATRRP
jgi:hypothetical protein